MAWMKIWLIGSTLLLSLSTAARAEPAWCKPVEGKLLHGNLEDALTNPDPRRALPSMVDVLCRSRAGTEEHARRAEVDVARQRIMKRLGMTEAEWPDAAEWAAEHQGRLMSTSLDYDRKQALSTLSPIDQFAAITNDPDPSYVADSFGHQLSEVGRFGFISSCIETGNIVGWAVCQADIDQLDRAKLRDELRTSKGSNGYVRMAIRIDAYELEAKLVAHAAKVKQAIAKDAAYATVFATALTGRKRWNTTDAKLAQAVLAMDDARITSSRRAYEGCEAKTWTALAVEIGKIPAKQFATAAVRKAASASPLERAATIIANEPNGYLAAVAYVTCYGSNDERADYLAGSLASAMARWPGFRGPRTMSLTTLMNAGIELDDRDAKLEFPGVNRRWMTGRGEKSAGGDGQGKIASVKITGDQAVVTFAKKLVPVTFCSQTKQTKRIIGVRPDGMFIFDESCVGYTTKTENHASPPQTVDARYAHGLKPGMVAWTSGEVVTFVWPTASAKEPSHVAGVAVQ